MISLFNIKNNYIYIKSPFYCDALKIRVIPIKSQRLATNSFRKLKIFLLIINIAQVFSIAFNFCLGSCYPS